jgi:beta-glucosidase
MTASTLLHRHAIMLPRYNLFTYNSGPNKRLGVPAVRFTDGPRGVSLNHSTCFPVSMSRGAAFDAELEERIGDVIGIEGRSQGANHFGGVCINLLRHPGWGRAQETYGEDQFHLGVMGVALTRGVQRHIMACAKHYACNSIEESRFFVNVKIDERTLREIYLPHFKKCVDAGVASIMSAYNKVNGHLCGHNEVLLKKILKEDWGFEGFVVSDFLWGVKNTVRAANAGLDIEMPIARFYGRKLKAAVKRGEVPEKNIDDSVLRVLRMKDKFSKVGVPGAYDKSKVACKEHTSLALEAARKGTVLLKNKNAALPLDREKIRPLP